MKATLDTNVFVSALNFGGVPERLFDLLEEGNYVLCVSPALVTELRGVLADRFGRFKSRSGTT